MKILRMFAIAAVLFVPAAGCAGSYSDRPSGAKKYVCPMKCVPPADAPGDCPKCGMKLVVQD